MTIRVVSAADLVGELGELNSNPVTRTGWPLISSRLMTAADFIGLADPNLATVEDWARAGRIPYFAQVLVETRDVKGVPTVYYNPLRGFGWAVAVAIDVDGYAIVNLQWKPGVNRWGIEFPPGGIGKVTTTDISDDELIARTQEGLGNETGYGGGKWTILPPCVVESGKFRGATADGNGLKAHLLLATDLEPVTDPAHADNELIYPRRVRARDLLGLALSGKLDETSAVNAVFHVSHRLGWVTEN
jgi:hypothetical protein